jgi:hypothetical protein
VHAQAGADRRAAGTAEGAAAVALMQRKKPMNRGKGFKPPERVTFNPPIRPPGKSRARAVALMDPERHREQEARRAALLASPGRAAVMGGATSGTAIEKERASQSQAYQAAVRSIGYCMRCGCTLRKGEGQFCHADQGKGQGLKTDVRRGWLGCAGCHFHVGTSGRMPKAQRRAEEDWLALKTRRTLRARGLWPKSLPDTWREHDEQQPTTQPAPQ